MILQNEKKGNSSTLILLCILTILGNVFSSLYDIREHFQGRIDKGKMNNKSEDTHYMELIGTLRAKLKILADKIAPKVYEYGFLKE
jgi:hypothetical protein